MSTSRAPAGIRLALVPTLLLLVGTVAACGSTGQDKTKAGITHSSTDANAAVTAQATTSASNTPSGPFDKDNDGDAAGKGRYDSDDRAATFGAPASAAVRKSIASLARHYYSVEATENGEAACSMLYSVYEEAVVEDYGTSPPGPAYARGSTCAAVLTAIFKHFHDQITERLSELEVSAVRVHEGQAVAILGFGSRAERELQLKREGKTWKVMALIDNELP